MGGFCVAVGFAIFPPCADGVKFPMGDTAVFAVLLHIFGKRESVMPVGLMRLTSLPSLRGGAGKSARFSCGRRSSKKTGTVFLGEPGAKVQENMKGFLGDEGAKRPRRAGERATEETRRSSLVCMRLYSSRLPPSLHSVRQRQSFAKASDCRGFAALAITANA